MSIFSGRSLGRPVPLEIGEVVKGFVDLRSSARGWAERESVLLDLSSSEVDALSSEPLSPFESLLLFFFLVNFCLDAEGLAHSGTG